MTIPDLAYTRATSAILLTDAAWSMVPSGHRSPQCPWEVYGHKHTSHAISRLGNASRSLGSAFTTGLSAESAFEPFLS